MEKYEVQYQLELNMKFKYILIADQNETAVFYDSFETKVFMTNSHVTRGRCSACEHLGKRNMLLTHKVRHVEQRRHRTECFRKAEQFRKNFEHSLLKIITRNRTGNILQPVL